MFARDAKEEASGQDSRNLQAKGQIVTKPSNADQAEKVAKIRQTKKFKRNSKQVKAEAVNSES